MTLWSLDTEDNSKGKVELINFYNGMEHHTFESRTEALKFIASLEGKHQIWCTNLQYDLVNLFGDEIYWCEMAYIQSRLITAKIKDTSINFYDTLNHWKISVAEMGKRIGHEKLEAELFNRRKKPTIEELKIRCQRDAEITYMFVNQMKSHYESIGCQLKATIGSTALKFFESKYYRRQNKRFLKKSQIEFMLKGYYGGRTEIFFNKPVTGKIQYYDFNSLYPSVMLEKFPILKPNYIKFTKTPNFQNEGMIHARIRAPNINIPYLPFRNTDTHALMFPLGTFSGHWTYFEIRKAFKIGYKIERIYTALEFSAGHFKPFESFVNDLFTKRLEAQAKNDELLSDAYKLLLNNLYGKYGQGNEFTKLIPHEKGMKLKDGDTFLGSLVLRKEKGPFPLHTNVIWAAYVTAYARHKLWEALNRVESQGGLLIYCDTDSIIFESSKQIFKSEKGLGKLKSEGDFRYAHFKLPKLYKLVERRGKTKYRSKGVPRKYAKQFFEKGKVKFKKPYKLRETLRRNISPKRTLKLVANYWDMTEKEMNKQYDKRKVLNNGNTEPIIIS